MIMVEESVFRGALDFFHELGIYDVILPFLLIFTIVFAVLEKTKILGTEKAGEHEYTKKNLNSIIAFVMAFFFIASTRLVAIVNETVANVALLLVLSICFLMLIGSFYHHEEKVFLEGGWRIFFMVLMFVGILLIFLNAIKLSDGRSVLMTIYEYFAYNWTSSFTASIIFLILLVLFILYVTWTPKPKSEKKG